jgi:nondiscriminating glutamyl-tRNA synthetase
LTNYLALLGWSPGEGQELLPLDELARRFRLEDVGHSAGVFDVEKLAWVNRHYLKLADPARLAALSVPYLRQAGWVTAEAPTGNDLEYLGTVMPIAAGAVDRLEQIPSRLRFLFDYSASAALADPAIRAEAEASLGVIAALAEELRDGERPIDRDAFRAMAARVRERTGQKGKGLFHPIRLALTGEAEGMELDLAVPLIERGSTLGSSSFRPIVSAADRAAAFRRALRAS